MTITISNDNTMLYISTFTNYKQTTHGDHKYVVQLKY